MTSPVYLPGRHQHAWCTMFSDEQLAVPSADDLATYDQTFASRNIGGFVDGNTAREIFMASQLPNDVLSAIWQLSDMDGDSQLSHPEFRIGMPTGLEPGLADWRVGWVLLTRCKRHVGTGGRSQGHRRP